MRPHVGKEEAVTATEAEGDAPAAHATRPALAPGSPEAESRLSEVKLSAAHLETLLMIPVRMALRADRHPNRLGAGAAAARTLDQAPQSPKIWARSMLVLKVLLKSLPSTSIRLCAAVVKAQKDAMAVTANPIFREHSTLSTVLHICSFAHQAPNLLEEALPLIAERAQMILQMGDTSTISDMCLLLGALSSDPPPPHIAAIAELVRRFVSEVTCTVEAILTPAAKEGAPETVIVDLPVNGCPLRVKHAIVSSLRMLDTMLSVDVVTGAVRHLVRLLPAVLAIMVHVLREMSDSCSGSLSMLLAKLGGEQASLPGTFLHALLLLLRMLRKPIVQSTFRAIDASVYQGVPRSLGVIAQALHFHKTASLLPDIMSEVFALIDSAVTMTSIGTLVPPELGVRVVRRMAELARAQQHGIGVAPFWLRGYEDLLYRLCVNEGARPPRYSACRSCFVCCAYVLWESK
jgi:hypothetical protein